MLGWLAQLDDANRRSRPMRGLDIASRTRRNCLCTQGIEGMLSLGMGLAVMTLIC